VDALSETETFELCKRALVHYKNKIEWFIQLENNEEIHSVLSDSLKPKLDKINEAIDECAKGLIELKNSFDLFKPRYIAAILSYQTDLGKTITKLTEFGNFPLNLEDVEKEQEKIEYVLVIWNVGNFIQGINDNVLHSDF